MSRSAQILAGVLLLFVVAIASSYWRMPRQKTVANLRYQQGMRAEQPRQQQGSKVGESRVVRLDILDAPAAAVSVRRDIFSPLYRQPKAAPVASQPLKPFLPPKPPVLPTPLPVPVAPILTPMQREVSQFVFLGFMVKDGVKTVFLSRDKDVILAKRGDLIADKYTITQLTNDILTLRSTDGEEIVVPLVENRPLLTGGNAGMRREGQ